MGRQTKEECGEKDSISGWGGRGMGKKEYLSLLSPRFLLRELQVIYCGKGRTSTVAKGEWRQQCYRYIFLEMWDKRASQLCSKQKKKFYLTFFSSQHRERFMDGSIQLIMKELQRVGNSEEDLDAIHDFVVSF